MTFQIKASHLRGVSADEFARRVAAFRQAKLDHHTTVDVPAPAEHPLVEAALRRVPQDHRDDYAIDYEIVDDTPQKSLRDRKIDLIHQVSAQERELMEASMPPGKRRLEAIEAHDIFAKKEEDRSHVETAFLEQRAARLKREEAIMRHAAKLMSQIEDLTEFDRDVAATAIPVVTRLICALVAALIFTGSVRAQQQCLLTPAPTTRNALCASTAFVQKLAGFVSVGTVNFNATGDTTIAIALPAPHYRVSALVVKGLTGTFGTAQAGLYTAASRGGAAIAAQQVISISAVTDNTAANEFSLTLNAVSLTVTTLYFNVGTQQGAAATGNLYLYLQPES